MPVTPADIRLDVEFRGDGGRWVRIDGERARVQITVGRTGNSLDPTHPVPLSRIELAAGRDRIALRARWPVAEVLTNRTAQVFDDLRGELREAGDADPDATIDRAVRLATPTLGDEVPDPAARILSAAYPLLARPLADGARPAHVPVALEPLLSHSTPRDAAAATLRPTTTTRPLVRALAAALLPEDDGAIAWERPLLALMAAARCGPEQLTDILTSPVHRAGAVSFSVADIQRARWMFADRHPRRVAENLCAALEQPDGTTELAREIAAFGQRPPPPRPNDETRRPVRIPRAIPERDINQIPVEHPRSLLGIDGAAVDGLRVRLPRISDDLLEWGLAMSNCLGAYRGPVARGHTHIIGFERGGELEVVAEVSRAKVLRQLEEPANTTPSRRRSACIVDFLRANGVVEADGRQS